jgi:hypothetical protein
MESQISFKKYEKTQSNGFRTMGFQDIMHNLKCNTFLMVHQNVFGRYVK